MTQPLKLGSSWVRRAHCCWLSAEKGTLSALLGSQIKPLPPLPRGHCSETNIAVSFSGVSRFISKQAVKLLPLQLLVTNICCQSGTCFRGEAVRITYHAFADKFNTHVFIQCTECLADTYELWSRKMGPMSTDTTQGSGRGKCMNRQKNRTEVMGKVLRQNKRVLGSKW